MPHESTVAHEQRFVMETPMISRTRTFKLMDEEEEQNRLVAVSVYKRFFYKQLSIEDLSIGSWILFQQRTLEAETINTNNQIPHARPETPRNVTHTHDEDCSDEDSDSQKQANQLRACSRNCPSKWSRSLATRRFDDYVPV